MAWREWKVAMIGPRGRPAKSAGFCRNSQQHAGTGAIRQENEVSPKAKNPNRKRLRFHYWWRRRDCSLAHCLCASSSLAKARDQPLAVRRKLCLLREPCGFASRHQYLIKKPPFRVAFLLNGGVVATGFKPRLSCDCGNVRIGAERCGIIMLLLATLPMSPSIGAAHVSRVAISSIPISAIEPASISTH